MLVNNCNVFDGDEKELLIISCIFSMIGLTHCNNNIFNSSIAKEVKSAGAPILFNDITINPVS